MAPAGPVGYYNGTMKASHLFRTSFRVAGACLLGALGALSAFAQAYPPPAYPPGNPVPPNLTEPITPPPATAPDIPASSPSVPNRDSEKFITKVSQLSSEQLRLSQIAAQRATNTQIRSLAQQVETSTSELQQ